MKSKKLFFKSGITVVISFLFFVTVLVGQTDKFRLPGKIDFGLTSKEIAKKLLADNTIQILRDTFDINDPFWIIYKSGESDTTHITFVEGHLSKVDISTTDSCYFYYFKTFCYDHYKSSLRKGSKFYQFMKFDNKEYHIIVDGGYVNDPRYRIIISSKKYHFGM